MADPAGSGGPVFRGEEDIIQAVFAPLAGDTEGAFGLSDDAALLSPASGEALVLTSDMIVSGIHMLDGAAAADIGYKALAVNVSDLIAKGADPVCYLLSIALPGPADRDWLEDLGRGLGAAQQDFGCVLVGGDTVATPGPISLSITAIGRLPAGQMVRRSGATPGDFLYVTGTIGDGVAGLALLQEPGRAGADSVTDAEREALVSWYLRPRPEPRLAPVVREYASAAMDVSDGLAADFAKLCAASNCGAHVEVERVPISDASALLLEAGLLTRADLISGGDDYRVLSAVPPALCGSFEQAVREAGAQATPVGEIIAGRNCVLFDVDGQPMELSRAGYDHF